MPVRLVSSRPICHSRSFDVVSETLEYPGNKIVTREFVRHHGAVVIIPVLSDGSLLLVDQYRAAIRRNLLEFPAGTMEPGEDPLQTAKREIMEEVGHSAEEWISLGQLYPAPGFCDELQHLYLARNLAENSAEGDEDELIEVRRLTVPEVEDSIRSGAICDAKSVSIFMRARLEGLL